VKREFHRHKKAAGLKNSFSFQHLQLHEITPDSEFPQGEGGKHQKPTLLNPGNLLDEGTSMASSRSDNSVNLTDEEDAPIVEQLKFDSKKEPARKLKLPRGRVTIKLQKRVTLLHDEEICSHSKCHQCS